MQERKKLIAFDMDSTLIQCEVIDEIARHNKVYEDVSKITEAAMQGKLDFNESLRKRVKLLEGTPLNYLEEFRSKLPFTEGLDELIDYLKSEQYYIIILSGGFDFFAKFILEKYQFDGQKSNQLEIKHNHLSGNLLGEIIDAEKKRHYLQKFASDLKIDKQFTVAVGDGANDLMMLQASYKGIAFNAKELVQAQARYAVNDKNIAAIIPFLKQ